MTSLKLGTSGLRGLVSELVGLPAYSHVRAFCAMIAEEGCKSEESWLGKSGQRA